jgi:hypothetical protein
MSGRMKLASFASVAALGLLLSYAYTQWVLRTGSHKVALAGYGEGAYWLVLGAPVIPIFIVLALMWARGPVADRLLALVGAAVIAVLLWVLGSFADFWLCVFITRGVCE